MDLDRMIDEHILESALNYLDICAANNDQPSLVGMWEFVDYYQRAHLPAAAVNAALKLRPSLFVHRFDGRVLFSGDDGEREVTDEDIQKNWEIYNAEFWAKYQEMQNNGE